MRFASSYVRTVHFVAILLASLTSQVCGQGEDNASISPPDRVSQPKPDFPLTGTDSPPPEFRLPSASALVPGGKKLASGLLINVVRFEIVGATAFAPHILDEQAAPFLNRPIGSEELEALRLGLTRLYIDAGYLNSGAIIPDQEVREGVVVIRIIEGTLNEIVVSGEHRFDASFVRERLLRGAGRPLHVGTLQESMQLMLQNPQIVRMNAELAAGGRLGESVLSVAVTEAPRHTLGVSLANNRSPGVGGVRTELLGSLRNVLGRGETWSLRFGTSRGLDDQTLDFAIPVTPADTQLSFRYDKNSAAMIEAPFDALDIDSQSRTVEFGLRHPWRHTLRDSLTIGAMISLRESLTRLGGDPFSFAVGVHDGRSKVTALRLTAEWLDRGSDHVFSARGVLSRGFDAFNATVNRDGTPDTRFTSALLQAQWVRRLSTSGTQLVLRADAQTSDTALLPLEKFAIGGIDSVRGFRENRLIRDRGWTGAAEIRFPVGRLALPGISTQPEDGRLSLVLFADIGQAWDRGGDKERLWGFGPGLRWDIAADSQAQLYWAGKRKNIENAGDDLQDRGIHFRLVMRKHF